MRIAIDLDGVVFDSEMYFMTMGEIYDCKELKGRGFTQCIIGERYTGSCTDERQSSFERIFCKKMVAFFTFACNNMIIVTQ